MYQGHVDLYGDIMDQEKSGEMIINAWLSPDGQMHPCGLGEHQQWAIKNGMNTRILDRYWIKLSGGEWYGWHGKERPTQSQINAIWDWHTHHKIELPNWFKMAMKKKS